MRTSRDDGAGIQTPLTGEEGVLGMGVLMSAPPQVDWLIDDVLPAKGRSMLYAAEKTGKSFVVLDMALHVATGKAWQGRKVKQGPVYYVASENAETYYARVQAWEKLHKGGAAYQRETGQEPPFYLIPRAHNLLQPVEVAALIDKLGPASLVIIDTLGRSMDGGDENSNADMNMVATAMDSIRDATGAAVLLVHHTGNEGRRARGASAQRGMVQTMIHLTRTGDGGFSDGGAITLTCDAQTRAAKFQPITLAVKLVTVVRGVTVPAIASGKAARKDATPRRVPFEQVYAECGGNRAAIMARMGLTPDAYRQRIRRMRKPARGALHLVV